MGNNEFDLSNHPLIESLGFKCGLEIHQQLNTKTKLFCHCPVGLTDERHNAEILRHMRPTLSELGEYDGTALMEFKTKKDVIYRLYRDRTCTYEMDDTPPFLVNQEAVDIAIRLAQLFNCRIVDELHVIRKQYLDGSIPTGFQRTMIIGIDGWVPYKDRKITVTQVNLEEEACREVSDIGHQITFATDRLSIPLLEVITGADMKNPAEAAEVCRLIGNAMKITGLVRRGIGTVRQDVNVSIDGGVRVEIKGVYKVGNINTLTAGEAFRQKGLLELRRIFAERFKSSSDIAYREINVTPHFGGTHNEIGRRLESDRPLKVSAVFLPNLADIISCKIQPNRDFGFELSGRVKVIACIDSKPNLFFYSQREEYDISDSIWDTIKDEFSFSDKDEMVIVCGPSVDVATAINEIKIRISELAIGVINETRQDLKDGTTDFERILPGPDRMYPDTDHPPVKITDERVEKCRAMAAEPLWEKQERWKKLGLHQEQIAALSLSPFAGLFDKLSEEDSINLKKAAHVCTAMFVALRREGYRLEDGDQSALLAILGSALKHNWPYNKLKSLLIQVAEGRTCTEASESTFSDQDFEKVWDKAKKTFVDPNGTNSKEKFRRFVAGKLMNKCADTKQVLLKINEKMAFV